jgi:Contractile injection system tube protein/LysM domain
VKILREGINNGMALEKAQITNTVTGEINYVMFNPEEYTLETGNSFAEIGVPGLAVSPIQYVKGNSRTLSMSLFFDTTETATDVRGPTGAILNLLKQDSRTQAPPILLVSWGSLSFECVLETVSQRFSFFLESGIPVRANLEVSFREYHAIEVEIKSGLFIAPPTVQNIANGETLSGLAGNVFGDPSQWREIAAANNIDDPLAIPPGQPLVIPPME